MSRINSNINSLIAQRILTQNSSAVTKSLERLSTGLAINRGADDPAGLIASEKLRSEKASIDSGLNNAQRADQFVNIAEGGLQEVSGLLVELQSLVTETYNDSGLSAEEKDANQLQVDAILQTIDRISSTTSFQGTKILNGGFDFKVTGVNSNVQDFKVNGAKIAQGGTVGVTALVTASAQHAGVFLSAGAAAFDLTNGTSKFTFELAGTDGTREFSFASGTTLASAATTINNFKSVTGVSAKASGTGIVLKTSDFGSSEFVSVNITSVGGQAGAVHQLSTINENRASTTSPTSFASVTGTIRDEGQDVTGLINGATARGKGTTLSVNTDALDASITLKTAAATAAGAVSAFTISGGGAKFNLGPTIDTNNQVRLGIQNVATFKLGDSTTGFLKALGSGSTSNLIDGNLETGQKIVNNAIDQVAKLRGRLGAFQKNVIGSTINALGIALENTTAAESVIRDTDFAKETAALTRSQILAQSSQNVLSIANSQPQSILRLLG